MDLTYLQLSEKDRRLCGLYIRDAPKFRLPEISGRSSYFWFLAETAKISEQNEFSTSPNGMFGLLRVHFMCTAWISYNS